MFSLVAGAAGGWLVYLFLAKVLLRSREELDPADYDMVGVFGTVCGPIHNGGLGEILFTQQGTRRAAAARSEDNIAILERHRGGCHPVRQRHRVRTPLGRPGWRQI